MTAESDIFYFTALNHTLRAQRYLLYSYAPLRHAVLALMSTEKICQHCTQSPSPDYRFRHLDICYKYTREALSCGPSVELFYACCLVFWIAWNDGEPIDRILHLSRGPLTILNGLEQKVHSFNQHLLGRTAVRIVELSVRLATRPLNSFAPPNLALLCGYIADTFEAYDNKEFDVFPAEFSSEIYFPFRWPPRYRLFRYLLSINRVEDEADNNSESQERLLPQLVRSIDRCLFEYSKQFPSLTNAIKYLLQSAVYGLANGVFYDISSGYDFVFWTCLFELLHSQSNVDETVTIFDFELVRNLFEVIRLGARRANESKQGRLVSLRAISHFFIFAYVLGKWQLYEGSSREAQNS